MIEPVAEQAAAARVVRVAALALLLLAGCLLPASPARAEMQTTRLSTATGRMLQMPTAPANVLLADPSIADVAVPAPTQVFLIAKKPGRTTLFALDAQGGQIGSWQIVVTISDGDLRSLIRDEVGDYPVRLAYTPTGVVLSGSVPSPKAAERVRSIAARYLGDGQVLVNNLQVTGSLQVRLPGASAGTKRCSTRGTTCRCWPASRAPSGTGPRSRTGCCPPGWNGSAASWRAAPTATGRWSTSWPRC